ncbi:alpha/beta hydrolase family protein [Rubrivirga sp. IMCC43871]|uniref:alpha/beta hydrolase family protein n=1 Tax=Rubrivirga sp. IMCC43871 TaxID=3391575 RepID=UPI00398FE200
MALRALSLAALAVLPAFALAQPQLDGPLPEPIGDAEFAILAQFFDYDRGRPLNARAALTCARGRCSPSDDRGTHVREKVVFDGPDGTPVPAYLALPVDTSGPHPVVVLQHGLNGSKADFWAEGSAASALRESLHSAGFAVLALDTPYHGERLHENGYADPPYLVLSGQLHRLRDMSTRSVAEHRRALDYLATRADIDAARVGALGFSQGAMHTLYLSAVEPRVRAAVVWATPMRKNDPLLYPGHFAQRVRDNAVLMVAGTEDPFYTIDEAETVWGLIPSGVKRMITFEGGHQLRPEEIPTVVGWLEAHLRPSQE